MSKPVKKEESAPQDAFLDFKHETEEVAKYRGAVLGPDWKDGKYQGMSKAQADAQEQKYGKNKMVEPPRTPKWKIFLGHQTGFFSLLLWLASILCFFAFALKSDDKANLWLGVVLAVVVFLTGVFSYKQDAKSIAVMDGFAKFIPETCNVYRDGAIAELKAEQLVPGDIIILRSGDKIPADLRIIEASNLKVDNSKLTGESEPQKRFAAVYTNDDDEKEATNVAFCGTLCLAGTCVGIVTKTGSNTFTGQIAALAQGTDSGDSPIKQEIHHFISIVSGVAVFLGVTFLIIGFVKGLDPVNNLVFAIGIIVANVPEGLLATVTVALTLTAQKMKTVNVLVKNLESVETLGSTTVIASDKTGTLTCNRMTVTHLFFDKKTVEAADILADLDAANANNTLTILRKVMVLCNKSIFTGDLSKPIQDRDCTSDASEQGFIKFAEQVQPITEMRDANKVIAEVPFNSKNKYQISINQDNNDWKNDRLVLMKGAPERILERCSTYMFEGKEQQIDAAFIAKTQAHQAEMMNEGERVLACAYTTLNAADYPEGTNYNTDRSIDDATLEEARKSPLLKNAAEAQVGDNWYGFPSEGLCFVGLVSLIDPPRAAVPAAVKSCKRAGVKVIMVTGDHPDTAKAIARQVHIIDCPKDKVYMLPTKKTIGGVVNEYGQIEGGEEVALVQPLSKKEKEEVEYADFIKDNPRPDEILADSAICKNYEAVVITGAALSCLHPVEIDRWLDVPRMVFARTSPAQKLEIVQALQFKQFETRGLALDAKKSIHHVVAVTGDGVNDSPALKAADIGVAMGVCGSDVAKEAADMILLDDNFASIVNGVEEGRLIFDNLKKSIAYTLSSNIPEISPFLVFILIQIPLPLPTVLILCIDLGTDMVPAISLAYENKESNIMQKPPRDNLTDRLVTTKMISFSYLQVGICQAVAGFYTYVVVLNDYGFPPQSLPWNAEAYDDGFIICPENQLGAPITEEQEDTFINFLPCANDAVPSLYFEGDWINLKECTITRSNICHDPEEALAHAQAAFFITIIVVQWADIIACKTRTLSLKQQGMRNGMLNFGLLFETVLGAFLCYVTPLNGPLGTRPISFVHWMPALPFAILILAYDEARKFFMRNLGEDNWVKRNTYY